MKIIEKAKKIYQVIVGDTQELKQDILLNHLIDRIELRDDSVYIKIKKNLILENEGHIVTYNSGMHVTLAKEIHLNPKIDFADKNFNELEPRLEEAEKIESEKIKQKFLKKPCGCS